MRVVWVSFDDIGRDCLVAAAEAGAEIAAVVTLAGPLDPDRSGQVEFVPVAGELGTELVETDDVNSPQTVAAVAAVRPDAVFVVGWSQLVREELIEVPPLGVFGMHPTLLPKHRGRAPLPWTILSGLARTGVTLFQIVDPTADSGPVLDQIEVPVAADETATSLYEKIRAAHVELIRRCVPALAEGRAERRPQDDRRASSWPRRTPGDGIIDWDVRAAYLYDFVRAQTRPYPGAFTFAGEEKIVVWRATPVALEEHRPAGTVVSRSGAGVVVACGDGALVLLEVEPAGIAEKLEPGAQLG